MDCVNCGAPLPAKSMTCGHCGTLNDVDLRAIEISAAKGPATNRPCPRCDQRMVSIELGVENVQYIERCEKCLGIFFDPGELEQVLDTCVDHVYEVNTQRIQTIIEEEYRGIERKVRYLKCPDCGKMMHRRSYGAKSGVVADSCRDHGIWLDGGELGQILKWAKAGGRMLDAQVKERQQKDEKRKDRVERRIDSFQSHGFDQVDETRHAESFGIAELLRTVFYLFR